MEIRVWQKGEAVKDKTIIASPINHVKLEELRI
jgi:hypothetical protein